MTIQDLGSIGELIAGIATVATLLYLAIQIRHSTRAQFGATIQSITSEQQTELRWVADYSSLFLKVVTDGHESLTDKERLELITWTNASLRARQNEYFQYKNGLLAAEVWESGYSVMVNLVRSTWFKAIWNERLATTFSNEFRNIIEVEMKRSA